MSFTLELTQGAIKAIFQQSIPYQKPFVQIIRLQKIESFQKELHAERYKLLLSDGIAFMQAVLSPKLNNLVYLKQIADYSVVKLLDFDIHIIKGRKLLVMLTVEVILSTTTAVIGSPVSVESLTSKNAELDGQTLVSSKHSTSSQEHTIVNSLSTDFLSLFNNSELSDITFILKNNEKLFAHRNILITRSSYFRSLFLNGMKESYQKEIEVKAWDPSIFIAIIRFIYTDQVLFTAETVVESIWGLFTASRYYGLERLQKLCQQFLINEKLSLETVCLLWNTASELDAKEVQETCTNYFLQHFENIMHTEGFISLHRDLFLAALRSSELMVSDPDKVSQAVLHWGRAQMNNPNSNITKQELFCTFFPLLRLKRRCAPFNTQELKQMIVEMVNTAASNGCRLKLIMERLRLPKETVMNVLEQLINEGIVFTSDGESFVSSKFRQKRSLFDVFL